MKTFSIIRQQLRFFGLNPEHWCIVPRREPQTYEFQHIRIPDFKLRGQIEFGQIKDLEIASAYW